jgi:hypothetical protein
VPTSIYTFALPSTAAAWAHWSINWCRVSLFCGLTLPTKQYSSLFLPAHGLLSISPPTQTSMCSMFRPHCSHRRAHPLAPSSCLTLFWLGLAHIFLRFLYSVRLLWRPAPLVSASLPTLFSRPPFGFLWRPLLAPYKNTTCLFHVRQGEMGRESTCGTAYSQAKRDPANATPSRACSSFVTPP